MLENNGFDAWEMNDPLEVARRSKELRPHLIPQAESALRESEEP